MEPLGTIVELLVVAVFIFAALGIGIVDIRNDIQRSRERRRLKRAGKAALAQRAPPVSPRAVLNPAGPLKAQR